MFNREKNNPCFLFYIASKKRFAVLLLLVPFLSGCTTQLFSFGFDTLFVLIQVMGVPFIIYVLIRMVTVQMAARFMKIRSAEISEATLHKEQAIAIPVNNIHFAEHREKENLLLNNEAANYFISAVAAGNSGWQLFRKTVLVFISGAVIIFFIGMFFYGESLYILSAFLLLLTGIMYLSVYLRYLSLRRLPVASVCTAYTVMMIIFFLLAGMFESVRQYFIFYLVLLLITLAFVLTGYIRNRSGNAVNRQLLILRIFGADNHTAFLFREISRTWRFLGSLVTIADASYLRYQYSLSSGEYRRRFLALFILYFFVLVFCINFFQVRIVDRLPTAAVLIWEQMSALSAAFIAGVIILVCSLVFVLPPVIIIVYRRFISSMVKMKRVLKKITRGKKSINGTFKNNTLFCIDNTWKIAVEQMLPLSAAVLMDLRGFSKQNKGCEYELGLLIDNYSVNKIVLLADEGPGLEVIKDIIREKWQKMNVLSPNARLQKPVLSIYFPGVEDKSDILRIIALLSMELENNKEEQTTGIVNQPASVTTTLQIKKLKLPGNVLVTGNGMMIKAMPAVNTETATATGRFEKMDLALAKPSVGKWFIPLLFLMLGCSCIYKLYPVFQSYSVYNKVQKVQALPGQPNNIDITGLPGITVTVSRKCEYNVDIAGGKLEAAFKYGKIKLNLLDIDGKTLADPITNKIYYEDEVWTWPVLHGNHPGDSSRISFTRVSPVETDSKRIALVKGEMSLFFIAPQDMFIANDLGNLLAQTGLVEIEFHHSSQVKTLWLQRSSAAPGEVHVIYKGNWDKYEVRLLNENGTLQNIAEEGKNVVVHFNNNSNKAGPFRLADFKNAWIEIIPRKKISVEKWFFETKNITVKQ